jgi:hypothetical protein
MRHFLTISLFLALQTAIVKAEDVAPLTEAVAPAPVEELGGYKVYGEVMPREGVVKELKSVFSDPDAVELGEGKYAGAIHKVCDQGACALILSAGEELIRVQFADEDSRVPADSAGSALVWGSLERNSGAGYRLVAKSILVKTAAD